VGDPVVDGVDHARGARSTTGRASGRLGFSTERTAEQQSAADEHGDHEAARARGRFSCLSCHVPNSNKHRLAIR
jgi:hypothetical protein